jgi:hypothetical protein
VFGKGTNSFGVMMRDGLKTQLFKLAADFNKCAGQFWVGVGWALQR